MITKADTGLIQKDNMSLVLSQLPAIGHLKNGLHVFRIRSWQTLPWIELTTMPIMWRLLVQATVHTASEIRN